MQPVKGGIIHNQKREEMYNIDKTAAIKELGMSKHIFKGLIVFLLAILSIKGGIK